MKASVTRPPHNLFNDPYRRNRRGTAQSSSADGNGFNLTIQNFVTDPALSSSSNTTNNVAPLISYPALHHPGFVTMPSTETERANVGTYPLASPTTWDFFDPNLPNAPIPDPPRISQSQVSPTVLLSSTLFPTLDSILDTFDTNHDFDIFRLKFQEARVLTIDQVIHIPRDVMAIAIEMDLGLAQKLYQIVLGPFLLYFGLEELTRPMGNFYTEAWARNELVGILGPEEDAFYDSDELSDFEMEVVSNNGTEDETDELLEDY